MGWAGPSPNQDGRMVGYGQPAVCDEPGCSAEIDRGLAYVCGGMHDSQPPDGCGRYFCYAHLSLGSGAQKCPTCLAWADYIEEAAEAGLSEAATG